MIKNNGQEWGGTRPLRVRVMASLAAAIVLSLAVSLGATAGAFHALENAVQDVGFGLRERNASGQIHIVEMDAASVAAINRWPWPRGHCARVVDQLDAAGVRSVAFDVDLSAPSRAVEDALLARSLERARAAIVLPVFSQSASFDNTRQMDTLPLEDFRKNVLLGSVSVLPDPDGLLRHAFFGTINDGAARASLAAQVAQHSGAAGTRFPIDFAIAPATIPRHSFIAIEQGKFDPEALRGKDVIIGATAIELGDRYAVPTHGIMPGVVVQALAAETLARGTPVSLGWLPAVLLAGLASCWILLARSGVQIGLRSVAVVAATLIAWHMASLYLVLTVMIVPAMLVVIAASVLRGAMLLHQVFEKNRMTDTETGLPNLRAMQARISTNTDMHLVAAMIDDFDSLKAVIEGDGIVTLLARIEDRLLASGVVAPIYRIDDRVLAWFTPLGYSAIGDQVKGLVAMMRSPLEVSGRRVDVRLAFGISEAFAVSGAVHAASVALRKGDPFAYHETAGKAALEQQISLMGELDAALDNDELHVLYQPKLDLVSDQITSAEALVRWQHPQRGYMNPDSFIPLAEEMDRIEGLTLFVLKRAIRDLGAWCDRGFIIQVAVNISARIISSPEFVGQVERLLQANGMPQGRLTFEITESATMRDPDSARAALLRFRQLGVNISMDDYGTGQSTLSYLRNFPLDELKIDRSFVQHAHRDSDDALMVRSTVGLAHGLGLKVVAEGVEDEACLAFLRAAGCDYAQGYHVGRPMPADELADTIAQKRVRAA